MGARPGSNNNGGPKTEDGRQQAEANLQPWAPTRHGLFTWTTRGIGPPCDKCPVKRECERYERGAHCAVAAEKLQAVVGQVMAEPHIQESDLPMVVEYARCVVGLDIAALHLDVAGPFLPGAEAGFLDVQPAQQWRLKLAALQLKYADALGLSPMARKRLSLLAPALPNSLAGQVLEAEFSARDVPAGKIEDETEDAGE